MVAAVVLAFVAAESRGQVVVDGTEEIAFDRPESWAMLYFGSLALMTSMTGPRDGERGRIDVGGDLTWVPSLSEDQRRVGFDGIKVEHLDRTDLTGHLRGWFGLPAGVLLEVGWTPPIEVDGIEPNVLAVAVSRPFLRRDRFRLGWRALAQHARFEGDITCDADSVAGGDVPELNPFRCQETSDDRQTIWTARGEVRAGLLFPSRPGLELFVDVGLATWDMELEVDARYGVVEDHSVLRTDGETWSTSLGLAWSGARLGASVEGFFAPLEVTRPPRDTTERDDLWTVRAMASVRVR